MKKTLPSDGLIPLGARQNRTPRGISVAPLTPTPSPILLDTNDLIEEVLLHWSQQSNLQRVEHLLLSSMDILFTKSSSIVTERYYFICLAYLARVQPQIFAIPNVMQRLIHLFCQTPSFGLPVKKANTLSMFVIHIVSKLFAQEARWPVDLVKAYVSDALTERAWVDTDLAKDFVATLLSAFGIGPIANRFEESVTADLKQHVLMETEKIEKLQQQQQRLDPKNFIKLLNTLANLDYVRLIIARNMESWMNNTLLFRPAKDLLQSLVLHLRTASPEDTQAVTELMRAKIKVANAQLFNDYLIQIINNNPLYCSIALRQAVYQEFSAQKSVQSMKMLISAYKMIPEKRDHQLGIVLQEIAANEAEHLIALRVNTRRMLKSLEKVDLVDLCVTLMTEREEMLQQPQEMKNNWINALVDMICYVIVLFAIQHSKDVDEKEFRFKVAIIQARCMEWTQKVVPKYLTSITPHQYHSLLAHLLFLKPMVTYLPPSDNVHEHERQQFQYWLSDTPVEEATVISIICMTLPPDGRLLPEHALDLIYGLVHRAASTQVKMVAKQIADVHALLFSSAHILDPILGFCFYRPNLPDDAQPLQFHVSIRSWFWKAVLIIILMTAFNPHHFGELVFKSPTIKFLIEKVIKNQMEDLYNLKDSDTVLQAERQYIDMFANEMKERNLNVEIFGIKEEEDNSELYYSHFMRNDFDVEVRYPPHEIIKILSNLCNELHLGLVFRSSRQPDFLFDVIRAEGAQQSIKWLGQILRTDTTTLAFLPYLILCELLLQSLNGLDDPNSMRFLVELITDRLCYFLLETGAAAEIIATFLLKIGDEKDSIRKAAQMSLMKLLTHQKITDLIIIESNSFSLQSMSYKWLENLQTLKCWQLIKDIIGDTFSRMINSSTDGAMLSAFVELLYSGCIRQPLEIAMMLGTFHLKRPLFTELVYREQLLLHKLTQKIYVEAFDFIYSIQHVLSTAEPSTPLMHVMLADRILIVPKSFLEGFISFLQLRSPNPSYFQFTDSLVSVINMIIPDSPQQYLMLDPSTHAGAKFVTTDVAKQFLQLSQEILIKKGLMILTLDDLLLILPNNVVSRIAWNFLHQVIDQYPESAIVEAIQRLPPHSISKLVSFTKTRLTFSAKLISALDNTSAKQLIDSVSLLIRNDQPVEVLPLHHTPKSLDLLSVSNCITQGAPMTRDVRQTIVDIFHFKEYVERDIENITFQLLGQQSLSKSAKHFLFLLLSLSIPYKPNVDAIRETFFDITWKMKEYTAASVVLGYMTKEKQEIIGHRIGSDDISNILPIMKQESTRMDFDLLPLFLLNKGQKLSNCELDPFKQLFITSFEQRRSESLPLLKHIQRCAMKNKQPQCATEIFVNDIFSLMRHTSRSNFTFSGSMLYRTTLLELSTTISIAGVVLDWIYKLSPNCTSPTLLSYMFNRDQPNQEMLSPTLLSIYTSNNPATTFNMQLLPNWQHIHTTNIVSIIQYQLSRASTYTSEVEYKIPMYYLRLCPITVRTIVRHLISKLITPCTMELLQTRHVQALNILSQSFSQSQDNIRIAVEEASRYHETGQVLTMWIFCLYPMQTLSMVRKDISLQLLHLPNTSMDCTLIRLIDLLQSPHIEFSQFAFSSLKQIAAVSPALLLHKISSIHMILENIGKMTLVEVGLRGIAKIYLNILEILICVDPVMLIKKSSVMIPLTTKYLSYLKLVDNKNANTQYFVNKFSAFILALCHQAKEAWILQIVKSHISLLKKLYALFPECEALATLCGMMELNDSVDKLRLVLYPNKKQLLSANDIIILQSHLQHSNTKSLSDREYLYQCSRIVSSLPNSNFSNSMCISMRNNQTLKTLLDLNTLSENVNIEDIGPILPNVLELCQMPLPEETLHIAYLLVVKYLEQYPRSYADIVPTVLTYLSHPTLVVRRTAFKFAYTIYPFCNEHKMELLERLFVEGKEAHEALYKIIAAVVRQLA